MRLFQQPFDASKVEPTKAFEPIPEAWYVLAITGSEAKPTKDNESGYLQLEVEVLDGEFKGRKIFDVLNLWNKSTQASEIAQKQLSAYCRATGVMLVTDSAQLHGIPIKGKVGIRKDEGFDAKNVIKAVKHIQDVTPSTTPQPAPSLPAVPFGQNPALPSQPVQQAPFMPPAAQAVQQAPATSPPWGQHAPMQQPQPTTQQPPWAQPAAAPAQQMQPQQQFAPQQQSVPPSQVPAAAFAAHPSAGPVPPWRK